MTRRHLLLAAPSLLAQTPAGTMQHTDLAVPAGVDAATTVPITTFRGSATGPVLAITAGIHGYEFSPILAAQRLLKSLDPAKLRGTVILTRVAHLPAFQRRSLYVNPVDGKNLNRVFPGRPDGTQSERIADVISRHVIAPADYHIDLHSGDGTEVLMPFVGIYGGRLAERQFETSKRIGLAFRIPLAVLYRMNTQAQVDRGRSCNRQAVAGGKPTVLVEVGELGGRRPEWVSAIEAGVLNALRTLGMLAGEPLPPAPGTVWCDGERGVDSEHTGILEPLVAAGQRVRAGQPIARVTGYQGEPLGDYRSPADGIVLHIQSAPPINVGDEIAAIAPLLPGA